jgi:hypothetical protein
VPLLVNTLPTVPGATNVGADVPFPKMTLLAVRVVRLVPPLATGSVPVTPVVNDKPVTLVITPDAGVPNAGVVSVGLVSVLLAVIDADFILLRGIVFSQRNCDYGLFITLNLV